jgi:hypothetical protein
LGPTKAAAVPSQLWRYFAEDDGVTAPGGEARFWQSAAIAIENEAIFGSE